MTRARWLFALAACAAAAAAPAGAAGDVDTGAAGDVDMIAAVVADYFDGVREGDRGKLARAFAESDAHMKFLAREDGGQAVKTWAGSAVLDRLSGVPDESRVGRIRSINIYHPDAAFVVFDFDDAFVDGFQMLRIDGAWRIVNKTYVPR